MTPHERVALPLLIASLVTLGVEALAQDPAGSLIPDTAARATELADLAAWCAAEGLEREGERVLAALLVVLPDDAASRGRLGFERTEDGRWERPRPFTPSKKTAARALAEYRRREKVLVLPLIDAVLAALKQDPAAGTPWTRREALRLLLEIQPRDARLREALGERRRGGRWVPAETLRSRRRFRRLRDATQRLVQRPAARIAIDIPEWTASIALPWEAALQSGDVLVVGTVDQKELESATDLATSALALCRQVFPEVAFTVTGYRIHLLRGDTEKEAWLGQHPKMTPERRRFLLPLRTGWAPDTWDIGIWHPTPEGRREWVARQTINLALQRGFNLDLGRNGAVMEGFGLYLGHLLTGTRSSWFATPSRYERSDEGLGKLLLDPGTSWMQEAQRRLKRSHHIETATLLGKGVNDLTPSDVLDGYVLAAWFLEGGFPGCVTFLQASGRGAHPAVAVPQTLGLTLHELDDRVSRWLASRKSR